MAKYATAADRRWAIYQVGVALAGSVGGTLAALYILTVAGTLIGLPHDPMPRWTFAGGVAGILAGAWSKVIGTEFRRLRAGLITDPNLTGRHRRRTRIVKAGFLLAYLVLPISWNWYWGLTIGMQAVTAPILYRGTVALCGRRNYRAASGIQEETP
ncbi:MAG TPA: hypothetical protein VGM77_01850 [Gemmatimonadales bacterium]|jgi:hypothetical protein